MISDEIRSKLQDIIRGVGPQGEGDRCSTVRNILIKSFGASPTIKGEFESRSIIKEKQVGFLKAYAEESNLLFESLPFASEYLTRGGESKVYLSTDGMDVFKVNDAIYYATWTEYITSLVLHNLLFPSTAYSLIGFIDLDGILNAILRQPFIEGEQAALSSIKEFLSYNGFEHTRRQDY